APIPYSVSPRRKLMTVGLKPSWNLRTRMPTRLEARKCPSSCTNTSTPSTKANDTRVISTKSSDLQFYPARRLGGIVMRPLVDGAHFCQRVDLARPVRIHRPLDHHWNRREADAPLEKPREIGRAHV